MSVLDGIPVVGVGDSHHSYWLHTAKGYLAGRNRFNFDAKPGKLDGPADAQFGRACQRMKFRLGYPGDKIDPFFGADLFSYMVHRYRLNADGDPVQDAFWRPLPLGYQVRRRQRLKQAMPVAYREPAPDHLPHWPFAQGVPVMLNGCPYQGTHTLGNWESDNAIDLNVEYGTTVHAVWSGNIGPEWGPLSSSDPQLLGQRLHIKRPDGIDSYYAHLSRLIAQPGQWVNEGDVIGYSGSANGVAHLHFSVEPPLHPQVVLGHSEWCW